MDITVYLPDEIGKRAKEDELPLSRMLRDAVTDELERREAVSKTLNESQTFEVYIEEDEGSYTGRITGTHIAEGRDCDVYLTDDERVILYDENKCNYHVLDNPEEELRDWLESGEYAGAMKALGITPVIDI